MRPQKIFKEDWDKVMQINVTGVFLCTKHTIPYLRLAGGGRIVNLSSVYGVVGALDLPPYHASKGAVRIMTKIDAMIYAGENIRVNLVHPAYIWTPMVEEIGKSHEEGMEAFRDEIAGRHPLAG